MLFIFLYKCPLYKVESVLFLHELYFCIIFTMITKATKEDVPQLVQLVNSAYRGESSKKGWTTEADLLGGTRTDEEAMTEMVTRPDAVVLKYIDNDETIGCVYLKDQRPKLYLGMLTVKPDLQAQGIGKKLLFAAEDHARQNGFQVVVMTVISVRHELIAWYQKRGYQLTGKKKPFPSDDPRFGIPRQKLEFVVLEKAM